MRGNGYLNGLSCFCGHFCCFCTKLLKLLRLALNGFGFNRSKSYNLYIEMTKKLYICRKTWLNAISPGLYCHLSTLDQHASILNLRVPSFFHRKRSSNVPSSSAMFILEWTTRLDSSSGTLICDTLNLSTSRRT